MSEFQEKRTGSPPMLVGGVEWHCWHTGICRYEYRSGCGRGVVYSPHHRVTYTAWADGIVIGKLYRSRVTAMKAAVKAMGKHQNTERSDP